MAQLLAMAGADLAHRTQHNETAAMIAAVEDKPLTAAWLGSVAGFSPVQICVALGNGDALRALLRRQECDPFARTAGTPALADLAAAHGPPLVRLCREVRSKWAPHLHGLFHPAHRSTVQLVMLVARCRPESVELGWEWVVEIPTEVWFAIAEHLGRTGWPDQLH